MGCSRSRKHGMVRDHTQAFLLQYIVDRRFNSRNVCATHQSCLHVESDRLSSC